MNRIGIITGLASEARCFARRQSDRQLDIACSGADPSRARELAQRMAAANCEGLVSFGLAGGLAPDFRCGDLILPKRVVSGSSVWQSDDGWRDRLSERLRSETNLLTGAIAGSPVLVSTPEKKAELRKESNASAVDMESQAVAAVAAEAKMPFIVVRVIADTYDKAVPAWTANIISPRGNIRSFAAMMAVAANPGDLPRLFALAKDNGQAMSVLRRVASLARGDFGFR